jgi:hypothetical protein
MQNGWQDVVALSLVVAAGVYLVRRGWLVVSRKARSGACGGCGDCPSNKTVAARPLVQLELASPGARADKNGAASKA